MDIIINEVLFVLIFPFRTFAEHYNRLCIAYFGDGKAATFFFVWSYAVIIFLIYAALTCLLGSATLRMGHGLKRKSRGNILSMVKRVVCNEGGELGFVKGKDFFKSLADTRPETIAIIGHVKPDGDCVSACSAMERYLFQIYPGAIIDVILDKTSKNVEKVLRGMTCRKRKHDGAYDAAIILDVDDARLSEEGEEIYRNALHRFCIDHHKTNEGTVTAEYCLVDPTKAAVCEILYEMFRDGPGRVTPMVARDLFVGIMTDTGGLKYSSVTPETFRYVADLCEAGSFDQAKILRMLFYESPRNVLLLTAEAVATSKTYLDGRVCVAETSWALSRELQATVSDGGKVPGELLYDEKVEVSVYFFEVERGLFTCSLRSKNVDISDIAQRLGGGGHKNAAGLRFSACDTDVMRKNILALISEKL